MNVPWEGVAALVEAGWLSLLDYLAAHVLLCLVPAFFLAGALSALVPKEIVTRFLGPSAPRRIAYPAAALGGFVLAVCSCTILPLFAGIWKGGAGLGPAVTFLFVGPAINVLAFTYTGAAIGMDVAVARVVLSVVFGIAIGLVMAALFRERATHGDTLVATGPARLPRPVGALLLLLAGVLVAGTLQADWLARPLLEVVTPLAPRAAWSAALGRLHLSGQGALLVLLLVATGPVAYAGFERVLDRTTRWTWVGLALVAATLLAATPTIRLEGGVVLGITGRSAVEALLVLAVAVVARWRLSPDDLRAWLWETWRFVKQIFPMLVLGVFLAGALKELIPASLVRDLAGSNTVAANLVAVVFGVFMYFPTLVEVPIARMFLDLGMHRGPLLAYLIADPALSIQSVLVTGRLLGGRRTAAYVGLVALFSTVAGLVFGAFVAAR